MHAALLVKNLDISQKNCLTKAPKQIKFFSIPQVDEDWELIESEQWFQQLMNNEEEIFNSEVMTFH